MAAGGCSRSAVLRLLRSLSSRSTGMLMGRDTCFDLGGRICTARVLALGRLKTDVVFCASTRPTPLMSEPTPAGDKNPYLLQLAYFVFFNFDLNY